MSDLYLLEKEAEFFERDDIINSNEIQQLEVDEDLPDIERVVYLLENGILTQILYILNAIPEILASNNNKENLITLFNCLKKTIRSVDIDPEILYQSIRCFMSLICTNKTGHIVPLPIIIINDVMDKIEIDSPHLKIKSNYMNTDFLLTKQEVTDLFLPVIINSLRDSEDKMLKEAATHCLISILPRLSMPLKKTEIITVSLEQGDVSQSIEGRKSCCRILGAIASLKLLSSEEIETMLFPKMLELCQDTDADVRRIMCEQIEPLARSIKEDKYCYEILTELLELIQDEEINVKQMAFRSLITLIDYFPSNERKNQIIPLLIDLLKTPPDHFLPLLSQNIGIMAYKLSKSGDFSYEVISSFQKAYIGLIHNHSDEIKLFCAYNFPGMLQSIGAAHLCSNLDEILQIFTQDTNEDVRKLVASSLHEISHLLGQQRVFRYLKNTIFILLKDSSIFVQNTTISRLSDIMKYFMDIIDTEQKIAVLDNILSSVVSHNLNLVNTNNWREMETLIYSIYDFPNYFSSAQIYDQIIPLLFQHMHKSSCPVQLAAAKSLVWFIRKNSLPNQRYRLINRLKMEFGRGRSFWQRILYLNICNFALNYNSYDYFYNNYMDTAIELLDDPIPNVRLKAMQFLPIFRKIYLILLSESNQSLKTKSKTDSSVDTSESNLYLKVKSLIEYDIDDADKDVNIALKEAREKCIIMEEKDRIDPNNEELNSNRRKKTEEEKSLMTDDHEMTASDPKWSDMMEYVITVGKDGTVTRRARVKSLDNNITKNSTTKGTTGNGTVMNITSNTSGLSTGNSSNSPEKLSTSGLSMMKEQNIGTNRVTGNISSLVNTSSVMGKNDVSIRSSKVANSSGKTSNKTNPVLPGVVSRLNVPTSSILSSQVPANSLMTTKPTSNITKNNAETKIKINGTGSSQKNLLTVPNGTKIPNIPTRPSGGSPKRTQSPGSSGTNNIGINSMQITSNTPTHRPGSVEGRTKVRPTPISKR